MFLTYQDLTIRNATAEDAPLLERWWNDEIGSRPHRPKNRQR